VVRNDKVLTPAQPTVPSTAAHGGDSTEAQTRFASSPNDFVIIENVTKAFGDKKALSNITFRAPRGQICGLLGPNGAGKTTLFRLLMGILKASSGKLVIDGHDAFDDRVALKSWIGFLPDEPVFYSYLSAREILQLSAAMHGLDVQATMAAIQPLVDRLRLTDDIDNFAEEYSRGMKKKLGLLLALLHRPKFLILDEPTNGLDVEATHLFYELVQELAGQGVTILFSTHLIDQVVRLCSHIVVMSRGAVVATGALAALEQAHGGRELEDIFLELTRDSTA
jgi:ABC-2 type transport system ATP-binding protein